MALYSCRIKNKNKGAFGKNKMSAKLPFHESVLNAIDTASTNQLEFLGALLKRTKIPKGHDEIIAAWTRRRDLLGWPKDMISLGVRTSLLEDKQEAEKKLAPADDSIAGASAAPDSTGAPDSD